MITENTSHLKLPLPHEDNYLEDDVPRLREALFGLDNHARDTDASVEVLRSEKADSTAVSEALRQKADMAAVLAALADKADKGELVRLNNTVTSTSTTEAATANAVKTAHDKGVEAKAAADAALVAAGQGFIAGGIVPFSGSFGGSDSKRPIPRGKTVADESWVLCDGTNGTPDMRDRFVVGAGGKYAKDSKGGSETHSHSVSGSAGYTTLSTSQMPSHNHTPIGAADGGYTGAGFYAGGIAVSTRWGGCSTLDGRAIQSAGGSGSHSHSLSASASTANGLPPYYALSYIMKL